MQDADYLKTSLKGTGLAIFISNDQSRDAPAYFL